MADSAGVFADQTGTTCSFNPGAFQLVTLYLVLDTNGATATKFKVNDAAGMTPTGSSVTAGFLSIGSYAAGIEIAYPVCQNGKIVIGTLGYFHQLEVMDCSRSVEVAPHPGSQVPGEVVGVDCALPFGNIEVLQGGRAWGGTDPVACGDCFDPTVPTSESTWGGIKALYR
jgi:hypothetical protein